MLLYVVRYTGMCVVLHDRYDLACVYWNVHVFKCAIAIS